MTLPSPLHDVKKFLTDREFPQSVDAAVILGSGLGGFVDAIDEPFSVPYEEIPGFPETSVHGHSGELYTGRIYGKQILAFSGRFHLYEGHEQTTTVLPVQIAKMFQAEKLIISNAAGAVNTHFKVGDLMIIDDVFRLFERISSCPGSKFRYLHYETANRIRQIAAQIGLEVQRGTYLFAKGPSYETKAEIRAFRILGADVVGMSTAPELIEASRLNLKTAAISLVTNMAAGVSEKKLDHSEVKETAENRKEDFTKLVCEIIRQF